MPWAPLRRCRYGPLLRGRQAAPDGAGGSASEVCVNSGGLVLGREPALIAGAIDAIIKPADRVPPRRYDRRSDRPDQRRARGDLRAHRPPGRHADGLAAACDRDEGDDAERCAGGRWVGAAAGAARLSRRCLGATWAISSARLQGQRTRLCVSVVERQGTRVLAGTRWPTSVHGNAAARFNGGPTGVRCAPAAPFWA